MQHGCVCSMCMQVISRPVVCGPVTGAGEEGEEVWGQGGGKWVGTIASASVTLDPLENRMMAADCILGCLVRFLELGKELWHTA